MMIYACIHSEKVIAIFKLFLNDKQLFMKDNFGFNIIKLNTLFEHDARLSKQ